MFRAGLNLLRRVLFAATLLILLICGAEVGVRVYEATSGSAVCQSGDGVCSDPSKLTVPSWSFHQELKPQAVAKVECRDSQREVEIRTNNLGLRGAKAIPPKSTDGSDVCRIVVLGDETIYAPEIPESEHFCTLLQKQLQQNTRMRIEVINAGIPGHCPLSEYLLFNQRLIGLQPDLVILHFDWSDVSDDRQMRRHASCESGVPQSCPHAKLAVTKKTRPHDVWRQQFRLLDWGLSSLGGSWRKQVANQRAVSRDVDTNPYAWLRDENPEEDSAFQQAISPITHLAELCKSKNIQFVLMTSPKPWQVSEKCSRGDGVRLSAGVARDAYYKNRAPYDALARFATHEQIPFFDGSAALPSGKEGEKNFLRHAPRWSAPGHLRMAEMAATFLIEKVPGGWNSPYFQQNEHPVTRQNSRENSIQWTRGEKQP